MVEDKLVEYYSARAFEYDEIYHRADLERTGELIELETVLRANVKGRRVLEVACGTGYWTEKAAETALTLTALDASVKMLSLAKVRSYPKSVEFIIGDAYNLQEVAGNFDTVLACFWFSHIPKKSIAKFLEEAEKVVGTGGTIFLVDNTYHEGIGGELITKAECEDTFKRRKLSDGSEWDILKNYFTESSLRDIFEPRAKSLTIHIGNAYWWASYEV